jgi:hypothetical protein
MSLCCNEVRANPSTYSREGGNDELKDTSHTTE